MKRERDNGGFLVTFAILLPIVIGFVAFAIDLSIGMESGRQARDFTKLATLKALEGYYACSASSCPTHDDRMKAARRGAQSILNSLENETVGKNSERIVDAKAELSTSPDAQFRLKAGCWTTAGFAERGTSNCSEEHNPGAMQIEGKYPFVTEAIFGKIFGKDHYAQYVRVTSQVIPRHIYFLVDASGSVVRDNFKTERYEDFAYYDQAVTGGEGLPIHTFWYNSKLQECDKKTPSENDAICKEMYVAKAILNDTDYDEALYPHHPNPSRYPTGVNSGGHQVYRINKIVSPQPLTDIFAGVNKAIHTINDHKIAGDRVGVIFFTNRISWPRMTNLTDDLDYLERFTDFTTNKNILDDTKEIKPNGEEALKISTEGQPAVEVSQILPSTGFEKAIRHGLFPIEPPAFTNIKEALTAALDQFDKNDDGSDVARSVILFSDGIQNCANDPCSGGKFCGNTYQCYIQGMPELRNIVMARMTGENLIPFHMFPIGNSVEPHTKIILKKEGGCYTDSNFRIETDSSIKKDSLGFVLGSTDGSGNSCRIQNTYSTDPTCSAAFKNDGFHQPLQDLYELAVATQGVWAPLRPQGTGTNCSKSTDQSCIDDSSNKREIRVHDPLCRTYAEQIDDYMQEIVGINPFRVVETVKIPEDMNKY